jgi:transglutaminase-like putative cysteine protease
MRIRVGCEFVWETTAPVPMLMLVRPRADADHITVYESRWSDPQLPIHEYTDLYGNNCWRFVAPTGISAIRYDAVVEIPETPDPVVPHAALHAVEDLPDEAIVFTLPSRYIESDKLLDAAWGLFGNTAPTWERIQAVCDWVHTHIEFVNGASTPATTAWDIYQQRTGVCRDFALLAVAFCRALNIPARYTFGYLPDIAIEPPDVPMDFHTWFEAYVGGRWYTFDARHNTPRVGRVVIGRGRDAVDCALSTAYGNARLAKFTVWSDEITAERPGGPPQEEDADNAEAAARAQP